jgi:hypothetical protein
MKKQKTSSSSPQSETEPKTKWVYVYDLRVSTPHFALVPYETKAPKVKEITKFGVYSIDSYKHSFGEIEIHSAPKPFEEIKITKIFDTQIIPCEPGIVIRGVGFYKVTFDGYLDISNLNIVKLRIQDCFGLTRFEGTNSKIDELHIMGDFFNPNRSTIGKGTDDSLLHLDLAARFIDLDRLMLSKLDGVVIESFPAMLQWIKITNCVNLTINVPLPGRLKIIYIEDTPEFRFPGNIPDEVDGIRIEGELNASYRALALYAMKKGFGTRFTFTHKASYDRFIGYLKLGRKAQRFEYIMSILKGRSEDDIDRNLAMQLVIPDDYIYEYGTNIRFRENMNPLTIHRAGEEQRFVPRRSIFLKSINPPPKGLNAKQIAQYYKEEINKKEIEMDKYAWGVDVPVPIQEEEEEEESAICVII